MQQVSYWNTYSRSAGQRTTVIRLLLNWCVHYRMYMSPVVLISSSDVWNLITFSLNTVISEGCNPLPIILVRVGASYLWSCLHHVTFISLNGFSGRVLTRFLIYSRKFLFYRKLPSADVPRTTRDGMRCTCAPVVYMPRHAEVLNLDHSRTLKTTTDNQTPCSTVLISNLIFVQPVKKLTRNIFALRRTLSCFKKACHYTLF